MNKIQIIEREMTHLEFKQMNEGFIEHSKEFGNPPLEEERYTFIVLDNESFVGCSSGILNDNKEWFYLTDLFIEKEYRGKGLGAEVLNRLEQKAAKVGVKHIWTWTAGYEAPDFYLHQGYRVFAEMKEWFVSGHSRVGFVKDLI
jgi:GNAT superfamily N-acetyltransferase